MTSLSLLALPLGCTDGAGDDDAADNGGSSDDNVGPSDADQGDVPDDGGSNDDTGNGEAPDTGTDESPHTGTDDDADTGVQACGVTPGAWEAPEWDANAADALALRAQLDLLTGSATMRGAEDGTVTIDEVADLTAVWDGTPSLAGIASAGYSPVIDQCFAEFVDLIAAGEQDLIDAANSWDPGADGGIWGDSDRGINEGGLEVRQLVDKGAYGGGLNFAYAASLTEGDIEPATIDAIAAIWGSNAGLDPEDKDDPLTDAASYAYQMGFHGAMAEALAAAKAYAADEGCTAERDAALVAFFHNWEQSLVARTVFYGYRAQGKLLVAATDSEFADVLHDLGEGIGVTIGFYDFATPAAGPLSGGALVISNDQVIEIAEAFGVDLADLGASTTGLFVESLPDFEDGNEAVHGVVMDAYGVDAATIMSYQMPTPG